MNAKSQPNDLVYYSHSRIYSLTSKDVQLRTHDQKGTLYKKNVSRNDNGTYKCEALDFDALEDVQLIKTLPLHVHCKYQTQTL